MNRLILTAALLIMATTPGQAESIDPKIQKYMERAVTICPGTLLKFEPVKGIGPKGFVTYKVTQTSSDSGCGRVIPTFVSPTTGQVIFGDIFEIPTDVRPLNTRIAELGERLLKTRVNVTIETTTYPDGVRRVSMERQTAHGPFAFHAWVDASGRFMIAGRRGNLDTDPGKTLLDDLQVSKIAAYRGTMGARIHIIELSDLQCPTCARAHEWIEPILKKYSSRISYGRMDLPLFTNHDWSIPGALAAKAIRKTASSSYWKFVDYVFTNQDQINKGNIDSIVKGFCEDYDVNWAKVEPLYRSQKETTLLLEQVSRAFDNTVNGTPTFIINGQFVHYGTNGAHLKKYLESLLPKK